MPTLAEILAGIQDEGTRSALKSEIDALSGKATKLTELETQLAGSRIIKNEVVDSWTRFDTQWKGGLKDKAENADKIAKENETLRSEVAKLKPEAERAAILAAQAEGRDIDPNKIYSVLEQRFSDRLLTPEREAAIRKAAVEEVANGVNHGSLPVGMKLLELSNKAYRDYGVDVSVEVISDAFNRFGGFDQAYNAVTKDAREAKATQNAKDAEAHRVADIESARREGREQARREFETNTFSEEGGGVGSGIMPMVTADSGDNKPLVDPKSYDPSQGVLASAGSKMLRKWQSEGKFNNVM